MLSKLSIFECTFLALEVKIHIKFRKWKIYEGFRAVNFVTDIYPGFLLILRKKHFNFTEEIVEVEVDLKELLMDTLKNVVKVMDCKKRATLFSYIIIIIF